ncbi:hypothetical protein AYL99_02348 [Fonsecaea erecta]|uniref:Uncharacterized protein n=1 Tax=Fonsecaea erecta TaxID=1367422 RepID=A0A178ZUK2_9EURO|nr:hypothetical protein AYL99_02348 [Fonsecaea erecta]OAP63121.1 hypothetical protein AYL99_02348 [Fonsecaea erecta]
MSAPRHSSPLSADLQLPCPILQSLRDTSDIKTQGAASDKVSRMDTIQEESTEPKDGTQDDNTSQTGSEAIPDYVLKIREAIKLQGQRHEETQLESEQAEKHAHESEKLDFHNKAIVKGRRTSLLPGAKERARDVVSEIIKSRSKRRSTVLPVPTKGDSAANKVTSEDQKKRASPVLVLGRTECASTVSSRRSRISAIFSPKGSKLPGQEKGKPKIKSKNAIPTYNLGDGCTGAEAASATTPSVEEVDETDNDSEVVGLLSLRQSRSSESDGFDASHFYTAMIPSGSGRDYEYRLDRSRFRHAADFSQELASKSVGKVRSNVGKVVHARRRGAGWSKLKD